MVTYSAAILWILDEGADFLSGHYSRAHAWRFDGGVTVPASSSPLVVPPPYSAADAVDPEEAFVASLSSCHMLWFLSLAAGQGYVVAEYRDRASGTMGKRHDGKIAMLRVDLAPQVRFVTGGVPSLEAYEALHHEAHERCYIASSVIADVVCNPAMLDTKDESRA